jgi:hypothetical protein
MPPITDPATETPAMESAENDHCVPLTALSLEGTPPEVGDKVTYTVRGTVTRVEGGEAYVTPSTVNDEPAKLAKEPAMDEDAEMMAMAMKADSAGMEG